MEKLYGIKIDGRIYTIYKSIGDHWFYLGFLGVWNSLSQLHTRNLTKDLTFMEVVERLQKEHQDGILKLFLKADI